MRTQYLLPCECGQKLTVDSGMCGLAVGCRCGKSVHVPTMRGLLQLEKSASGPKAPPALTWGAREGMLLLGLVIAIGAAGIGMLIAYLERPEPPAQALVTPSIRSGFETEIDGMSPMQTVEHWNKLVTDGIGQPQTDYAEAEYQELLKERRIHISVAFVVAVFGLALSVGGLFAKKPAGEA
jgi:hypothetical protein